MKRFAFLASTWVALTTVSIGILLTPTASAAPATPGGQALEIAPPIVTLSVNPGQTITTQISLRDISSGNLLVHGQVNDFVAAGEDGTPKILLNNDNNNPYSLISWVKPFADVLMIPHQIRTLPVTIKVPESASPGGHYGVIRFTATAPELHGTGVSLATSLGSLVLLTVSGNVKESVVAHEFSVSHAGKTGTLFESAPVQFTERFQNNGNVHEEPTGQVVVTDMFGKTVGAVNINMPPKNILPQSIRKFDEPFDSTVIGNKKLFGRYTAKLNVTYGVNKQVITSNLSFWVIPYRLIGAIIVILVAGFFVLRILIRHYNRRIIAKAQRK